MTVKTLHTFTDAEIDTIADSLRIADAEYRKLAELMQSEPEFRQTFIEQALAASALQLRIEATK